MSRLNFVSSVPFAVVIPASRALFTPISNASPAASFHSRTTSPSAATGSASRHSQRTRTSHLRRLSRAHDNGETPRAQGIPFAGGRQPTPVPCFVLRASFTRTRGTKHESPIRAGSAPPPCAPSRGTRNESRETRNEPAAALSPCAIRHAPSESPNDLAAERGNALDSHARPVRRPARLRLHAPRRNPRSRRGRRTRVLPARSPATPPPTTASP